MSRSFTLRIDSTIYSFYGFRPHYGPSWQKIFLVDEEIFGIEFGEIDYFIPSYTSLFAVFPVGSNYCVSI